MSDKPEITTNEEKSLELISQRTLNNKEILKFLSETQNEYILIDAYGDIELEDFLNLGAGFKERLRVVY